jgi:hypothetical protein
MLFVVADECRIPLGPDRRRAIQAAIYRMMDALGVSSDQVQHVYLEMREKARGTDCTSARASYDEAVTGTLAEADRALAR